MPDRKPKPRTTSVAQTDPPPADPITVDEMRVDLFCAYLLTGMTIVDAHNAVGYSRDTANASAYHRSPPVQGRLSALRTAIEKRTLRSGEARWDDDTLAKFLQDNAIESRAQGDYAPSNRAIELLGKDRGMFGQGGQELLPEATGVDDEADQASLAAAWLREMAVKLGTDSVAELAQRLEGHSSGDTIDNAYYGEYEAVEEAETEETEEERALREESEGQTDLFLGPEPQAKTPGGGPPDAEADHSRDPI